MRHLIDSTDLSVAEIDRVLNLADDIIRDPAAYAECCRGKILATLFYEPSTRTRLSFEAAMLRLGGKVEGFSSASSSSVSKGETVADTVRVVGSYADIIAMRHNKEGAPRVASMYSPVPIINAGDGGHQHPTQTLTDLLTIRSLKASSRASPSVSAATSSTDAPFTRWSRLCPGMRVYASSSSPRRSCRFPVTSSPKCWSPAIRTTGRYAAWRRSSANWMCCT